MEHVMNREQVDVLIVGSGPIGATFARVIANSLPAAKILMVDLGPQLTARPGMHIKNIADPEERGRAQIRSQGPTQYPYEVPPSIAERAVATAKRGRQRVSMLARPGTHLINPDDADLDRSDMPAAAASSNVGGMAAHWTCACPRPGNTERIPFIPDDEWNRLCSRAEELLCVTQAAFPLSVAGFAIQQALGEAFDAVLPEGRKVQPMPLAVQIDAHGQRRWTGPDVILGPLADAATDGSASFTLRAATICRQLFTADNRVTRALLEHLPSGRREEVVARVVVVAADSLRTPQLLWASGIRPPALGHYLNDHLSVAAAVTLNESVLERARLTLEARGELRAEQRAPGEAVIGVFWVPFHDPAHLSHGQVMQLDASPIPLDAAEARVDPQHIVVLGWGCRKELRYADYIEFSATETDYCGMPKTTIHYELTARDKESIAAARKEQARAAAAFGRTLNDDEPRMLPPGTSLHYQGTIRMGESDDSQSVCDPYARVWGWPNLFVGGNGVIPTVTLGNPTLTSVALAVRAAEQVIATLS